MKNLKVYFLTVYVSFFSIGTIIASLSYRVFYNCETSTGAVCRNRTPKSLVTKIVLRMIAPCPKDGSQFRRVLFTSSFSDTMDTLVLRIRILLLCYWGMSEP
jgi:hypothetical protein